MNIQEENKIENTTNSISGRLRLIRHQQKEKAIKEKKAKQEEKERPIIFKKKRTFYLTHESNDKLNKITARMMIRGDKVTFSDIIEKAIDELYKSTEG